MSHRSVMARSGEVSTSWNLYPTLPSGDDQEERAGGRSAAARTRLWWGEILLERGAGDDLDRARDLLATAAREADEMRLAAISARATELLAVARTWQSPRSELRAVWDLPARASSPPTELA